VQPLRARVVQCLPDNLDDGEGFQVFRLSCSADLLPSIGQWMIQHVNGVFPVITQVFHHFVDDPGPLVFGFCVPVTFLGNG